MMDSSSVVEFICKSKRLASQQPYCSLAELGAYQLFLTSPISLDSINGLANAIGQPPLLDHFITRSTISVLARKQVELEQLRNMFRHFGHDADGLLCRTLWAWAHGIEKPMVVPNIPRHERYQAA